MIDIHCHILPGIDDGPRTMSEALAMARMAVADGIEGALCTPHWHPTIWPNEKVGITSAVAQLQARLAAEDIPLKVWAGSELSLDADLESCLDRGLLCTINGGSWILLELPGAYAPPGIDDYLWSIRRQGYQVVLAHPERYDYVLRDPARLHAWVEMGVAVQVTASSLLGRMGSEVASLCRTLLEHRLVHFLATDGHGPRSRRPMLKASARAAAEVVGSEDAQRLVVGHPQAVLRNEALDLREYAPRALPARKKTWFSFFCRAR